MRTVEADETKAAFARADELAGGPENAAERFPAYWAQWVRNFVRADLRLARRTAETFLREAEEGGYLDLNAAILEVTALTHSEAVKTGRRHRGHATGGRGATHPMRSGATATSDVELDRQCHPVDEWR
jgi:hypothetical protein